MNGSFESRHDCNFPPVIRRAVGWSSLDSVSYAGLFTDTCNARIPKNANTWQFAKHGQAYIVCTFYWKDLMRGYMRNRLRSTLISNNKYCIRFYINIANSSPRGIDGFGAYFGDSTLDTIKKCNVPLVYLNPQVENPLGNVISDTLTWIPITGTFVANGTEKYLVIGNFLADNAVTTSTINGPNVNEEWTDVCIDDVSCFDIDLPAYAGPDKTCIIGDSVFLGTNDWGLNEFCTWYQLPNMSTPIATLSGLFVKPVTTTTYVVRQQLWCSGVKWDTVVVYKDQVGLQEYQFLANSKIYPNPALNHITLKSPKSTTFDFKISVQIFDGIGRLVLDDVFLEAKEEYILNIGDLIEGVYQVKLTANGISNIKPLVIKR